MNKRLLSFAAILVCALPTIALSDDAKLIQGVWSAVKWTLAGSSIPPPTMRNMKLTMKAGEYDFVEGTVHDIGKIILKPGQSPKAMDIVGVKGPNAGKTIPAIYRLKGDKLTVCYGLDGHRPKEFVSPRRKMILLLTFSRKTSSKP